MHAAQKPKSKLKFVTLDKESNMSTLWRREESRRICSKEELAEKAQDIEVTIPVLLIFAKYLSLYLHIFTCTYKGAHTPAHMYNQHTRGIVTTRHRSLVERGGRKALLETLHTHTHKKNRKKNVRKKPIFTNFKKRFEHIELPAKLLDYFSRINESNINQTGHQNANRNPRWSSQVSLRTAHLKKDMNLTIEILKIFSSLIFLGTGCRT